MPEVSVVTPVFNREELIAPTLASILRQDVDAEILVVDDGSSDRSTEVIRDLAAGDRRIVLMRGPNRGPAAARNRAISIVKGEYLTFVDSDDLCPPGRIRRQISKLCDRRDVVAVIGTILAFDSLDSSGELVADPFHVPHYNLALHSATFRATPFRAFGPLDEGLAFAEDVDFFLRLFEANASLLLEAEIASYYRIHPGNMVRNTAARQRGYVQAYARSIARRRAMGRTRPLQSFFLRPIAGDVVFGGAEDGR
jgi:glycosyltransferase involved in cell wall biosynthesis